MNPKWDSKYTTNINTQMNYWPAEVGNLSELTEPLTRLVRELTEQGSDVAREHYGAQGWVHHQNTDLWRVAAPMDGPTWGTFATGGAWLATHLWEHYLYTGDEEYLEEVYPILRRVRWSSSSISSSRHPRHGWLVTNPSTSPENFPDRPRQRALLRRDDTRAFAPGTSICAGSTIDIQILRDLFSASAGRPRCCGVDEELRDEVLEARDRLAPMQIGGEGDLQEWLEDWGQKETSHRHISHLYGLFRDTRSRRRERAELAEASRVVLEQEGARGQRVVLGRWKIGAPGPASGTGKGHGELPLLRGDYTFDNLFAICSRALQVDGEHWAWPPRWRRC